MKDENTILYVQTSDAPERQYSPLVLAQTAKAMGLKPMVYYLGMGLNVLGLELLKACRWAVFPVSRK